MKPKEFDELIKQKFDRNDFAYNPENWDRLAEKLEGRDKKRSLIVWWWIPLAGMAASVALAFGVSTLLRLSSAVNIGGNIAKTEKNNYTQRHTFLHEPGIIHDEIIVNNDNDDAVNNDGHLLASNNTQRHTRKAHKNVSGKVTVTTTTDWTEVTLSNALKNIVAKNTKPFNLLSKDAVTSVSKNKQVVPDEVVATFKPEEEVKKAPKLSVILSGGFNHGNANSGYMAGATIRRMVNDKVYVESDVAFASSTNTQMTEYAIPQAGAHAEARQSHTGARTTSTSGETKALPVTPAADVIGSKNISYNLYYAQVSPSLGYKVIKRMSIGLGPDFQRMLVDNRPAPSTVDRGVVQVAPLFDVGFIGKTEYALTKKVRAGVYYRKGVNNIITPTDKFIDRDYLQFQVKYTIFNK